MTRTRWRAATPLPKRWREWQAPIARKPTATRTDDGDQLDLEDLLEQRDQGDRRREGEA